LTDILIKEDLLELTNIDTKIIFGWEKSLDLRKYLKNMIDELFEFFYLEEEIFMLVAEPITKTDYYSKLVENLGPAEIVPVEIQNPGLLDLAELFSIYRKNKKRIVVGLGGGSVMDLAKAITGWSYHTSFIPAFPLVSKGIPSYPLDLIPSIAGSGSEVSPYIIMTDKQGYKVTTGLINPYLTIVDPSSTTTTPHYSSLYSALTAFGQAIEALASKNASEETDIFAYKAIEIILYYLPKILQNKEDVEGRKHLSFASLLAGLSMEAGLGLATSMAHQIHDLPHGLVLSLLLPSIIKFNSIVAWEKFDKVNKLFIHRSQDLSETIQNWFNYLGVYSFCHFF